MKFAGFTNVHQYCKFRLKAIFDYFAKRGESHSKVLVLNLFAPAIREARRFFEKTTIQDRYIWKVGREDEGKEE